MNHKTLDLDMNNNTCDFITKKWQFITISNDVTYIETRPNGVTDEISLADFIGKYYSGEGLRLGQSMPHGGVQWN